MSNLCDAVTQELLDQCCPVSALFMFERTRPEFRDMPAQHAVIQARVSINNISRVVMYNDLDYTEEGMLRRAKFDACM